MTALRCLECERPICVDCSVRGAVGIKCRDCGQQTRAALAKVPRSKFGTGVACAAILSVVAGFVFAVLHIPFIGWIIAYFVGQGIAAGAVRAAGGFRDPALARAITICTVVGFVLPFAPAVLTGNIGGGVIYSLIAAAAAGFGAWQKST